MVRIQQTQTEELRCGLWRSALEGNAFESRSLAPQHRFVVVFVVVPTAAKSRIV
jgi:hypothetical protein